MVLTQEIKYCLGFDQLSANKAMIINYVVNSRRILTLRHAKKDFYDNSETERDFGNF